MLFMSKKQIFVHYFVWYVYCSLLLDIKIVYYLLFYPNSLLTLCNLLFIIDLEKEQINDYQRNSLILGVFFIILFKEVVLKYDQKFLKSLIFLGMVMRLLLMILRDICLLKSFKRRQIQIWKLYLNKMIFLFCINLKVYYLIRRVCGKFDKLLLWDFCIIVIKIFHLLGIL